jgi:hypothetical protein
MQYQNPFKEMNLNVPSLLLGGLAGLAVGSGGTYLVLRRTMAGRFSTALDAEVAAVKTHYNDRLKDALSGALSTMPTVGVPFVGRPDHDLDLAGDGGDEDDGEAAMGDTEFQNQALHAADIRVDSFTITDPLEGLDGGEKDPEDAANEEVDAERAGGLLDTAELARPAVDRDLRGPYVISLAEFVDPLPGWQQLTVTYFAVDPVLVDDKNDPIPNFGKIVGPIRGPQDFGGISEDPHLRYVRNQSMQTDFEIVLDGRSYAEGVLHYGQPNKEH